jgi:hypothetical protein
VLSPFVQLKLLGSFPPKTAIAFITSPRAADPSL